MVPIIKGIGVLAIGMMLPAVANAQVDGKGVKIQDFTSSIKVTNVDGATIVTQQVGAPLGMAILNFGDDIMLQGLFAALTGIDYTTVGVDDIISDKSDVALAYDAVLKALRISVPDDSVNHLVFVVDENGKLICKAIVKDSIFDLSELAPGIYIAGLASDNKYSKTLKFIVK